MGCEEEVAGRTAGLVQIGVFGESNPSHGYVILLRHRHFVECFGCLNQFGKGRLRLASAHADHLLLVVLHHVDDEPQARPSGCLRDGFVKRIGLDATQARAGMVDHQRAVGVCDHGLACRPNGQRLAPARVTGILVWFDDACGDEQIGFVGHLVHRKGDPALGGAQIHQGIGVLRLVVDDPVAADYPLAQLGDLFLGSAGAVHADPAQQGDVLIAHARCLQVCQQRRHQQVVRAGPRNVGENNADLVAGACHLAQLRRIDRGLQRFHHRRGHILDRGNGFRFDNRSAPARR